MDRGVGIMSALMDASPTPQRLPKRKPHFRIPPPLDPMTLLVDGLTSSCSDFAERIGVGRRAEHDRANSGERWRFE